MNQAHIGSSFDDILKEEGIYDEVTRRALERVAEAEAQIDTGDEVLHIPTGESWVVAYVENGRLACCGWPYSLAELSDCQLTGKATLEQRQELLERMAMMSGDDPRKSYAVRVLADRVAKAAVADMQSGDRAAKTSLTDAQLVEIEARMQGWLGAGLIGFPPAVIAALIAEVRQARAAQAAKPYLVADDSGEPFIDILPKDAPELAALKARIVRDGLTLKPVREALADVQHEIWSHWMRYFFTKCNSMRRWLGEGNEETLQVFPQSLAERWQRQMNTPYAELSEQEQRSDLDQADKILAVLPELSALRGVNINGDPDGAVCALLKAMDVEGEARTAYMNSPAEDCRAAFLVWSNADQALRAARARFLPKPEAVWL